MYLNKIKFWTVCPVAGIITLFFGVIGLLGLRELVESINIHHTVEWTIIVEIVFMEFIAWISFRFFWDAVRANRISRIFAEDEDGLLDIEDVAERMKMKRYRFFVIFHRLVGKKLLQNCSVFSEDPTCIILANEKHNIRAKFTVCRCRNCGAPNTLRIDFEKECKYCGAKI